ncbi:ArsR/SmtB family transcription factor [Hydrogenimonas urashimensis]|uniref:ArsR/SmtB family transcription factor n=1 Tax=Hydrogenimonas urashimensis TaxID=2740515 RepID=UPI001914EBA2|nr:metalloregulator ArsR/SmtB family transcription factor [Hydrogenimonas urashimensis]
MEKGTENFLKAAGALYDETRIRLLKYIDRYGPLCVCELEEAFKMLQSRLSRHLKILKEAGFLTSERRGRWVYYAIHPNPGTFHRAALEKIRSLPLEIPKNRKVCNA